MLSTVTRTGRELAGKEGHGLIEKIIYMPLDLAWVVKRALGKDPAITFYNSRKGVLAQHDQARRLFRRAGTRYKRDHLRAFILPGTLRSPSSLPVSLKRYRSFAPKEKKTPTELVALGVEQSKVHAIGNIKFDMEVPSASAQIKGLRETLGITKDDTVIVAGSTHAGEEVIILDAYKELKDDFSGLKLIIAPRHPNRFDEVERIIKEAGFKTNRRSQCAGTKDAVILLDTVGELFMTYALATINFVGGSLVPVGGHNLLEPAFHSTPVLYGTNIETCRDMAKLLRGRGWVLW